VLSHSSPLLEEERHLLQAALAADTDDPFLTHRARVRTAFAADDDPVDADKIQCSEILQERLDRKKSHGGRRVSERGQTWQAMLAVFDAHAEPDVGEASHPVQVCFQKMSHSDVAFGQHLKDVPVGAPHHIADRSNVGIGHAFVK